MEKVPEIMKIKDITPKRHEASEKAKNSVDGAAVLHNVV